MWRKISSYSSKSRGVAILFKNIFEFKIHEETIDLMGNFILLNITIQDYRITLAAIYGPNNDDPVFFENIKHKISQYGNLSIVVAGDWNVLQDYDMDTLHYRNENNPQSKAKIHVVMHELDLLDIWRKQPPFDKKNSWRGPNHKQSCLDYFMITSNIEAFVVSSDIGKSYRSDHSPVLINLRFSSQIRGKGSWKFNNSLLRETEFIEKVKGDIKTVIEEYESDPSMNIETEDKQFNISYQLLRDMIKMKVRGSAISFSSFQKKKGKKEKELQYKISLLDEKLLKSIKKMDAQAELKDIIDRDSQRRDKIFEVYKNIKELLQRDENLRHIMTTEFGDVTQDLDTLESAIKDTECPILVAGETSAGKSSVINLLIGKHILPEKLLSSTSTICKIWNREETKIILTDLQEKTFKHLFEKDTHEEQMKAFLAENVGKGSDNNPWKSVDICLPVPLLQENTPIVDTPGIGNRKALMERLFNYLPNAMAFIYVINAGNAGGVEHDDWLKKILSNLSDQHVQGKMLDFDTETTLFVCNKWDQVDEEEEEDVLETIINKLRSEWPNVNPDQQLFKLSCKKEKKLIRKKKSPSENYQRLVKGITEVMPKTLQAKLVRHVRWQKHFIEKMFERIGSKIKLSKEVMSDREDRKKEAEKRLNLLEKNLETVKKSALAKMDEKCKAIAKEVVDHLNVVKDGFIWKESELPEGTDMKCVAAKATELIRKKIHDEITDWRLSRSTAINAEIESIIASEFQIIEDDLRILQNCFGSLSRYTSMFMPVWSVMSSLTTYFTMGTGAQIVSSPIMFFGLIGLVVFLGELPFTFYYNYQNNEMTKKYNSNKLGCMKEWVEITLKKEVTVSKIYTLMKPFIQNMKNNISYICETVVPNRISADKMCIDDVIKERRSDLEILKQYNPIQCCCEMIIGKIEIICMEYFPKSPLYFHYIEQAHLQDEIGSGSFSIVHSASISIENENIFAAVKTSKKPIDSMSSYQAVSEAIILRQLQKHPNVLKLYGLSIEQDAGKKFLQIFLELCDDSLYNIVMVKRKPSPCGSFEKFKEFKDSWRFVLDILEGVCSALDYIHNKGFVHRDLKLANIMVKGECTVKLADFGISKKEEHITGTSTGTPLYMAPEVLKGNLYGKEADIYSLGMVIYELWYYRPVFTNPSQSDATKFENIVNTREELTDYVISRNGRPKFDIPYTPPLKLKAVMKKCWNQTKEVRPPAKKVYEQLCAITFS